MYVENVQTFEHWRTVVRRLVGSQVPPAEVHFTDGSGQLTLFDPIEAEEHQGTATEFKVSKTFVELARHVACHRQANRWSVLYRTLWRLLHGEPYLLQITTDDDVYSLTQMRKAVARDVHKMKAFVRFRKISSPDGEDNFIAWHRPDHRIVRLAAPFFSRRFKEMNWSIWTPDESVTWDKATLHYGPGVPAANATEGDALEEMWKTYYASIFNPARVKIAMMKREMPVRHWPTLPEASLIDELLQEAPTRVEAMIDRQEGFAETATQYLPLEKDLSSLQQAARQCRACHLCLQTTQTVFGEGPANARIVFVGEQPGDREDVEGHPFVGPAGKLLDEALQEAGIDRTRIYITNVVKHFKFTVSSTPRGKRRLHQRPDAREIYACRPWLEAELHAIQPQVVVCLGATPAQALFGRDFRVTTNRGKVLATDWCARTMATWHPAAVLRMPDVARQAQMRNELFADVKSIVLDSFF